MKNSKAFYLVLALNLVNIVGCATSWASPNSSTVNTSRGPASPHLSGGVDTGGGSGCMAEFMRAGYQVSDWLTNNGQKLQPPVRSDDFLRQIDPSIIVEVPADQPLDYHGNPVDAYFTGTQILVRCDRFLGRDTTIRQRVVAHEIFRRMGLEGDAYEISRQIWSSTDPSGIFGVWLDQTGCYQVQKVLVNGQMQPVPEENHANILIGFDKRGMWYDPVTHQSVPEVFVSAGTWNSSGPKFWGDADENGEIFLDRGTSTQDQAGVHYEFTGEVANWTGGANNTQIWSNRSIREKLDMTRLNSDQMILHSRYLLSDENEDSFVTDVTVQLVRAEAGYCSFKDGSLRK